MEDSPKLIVTTGISGCGRKEYLRCWEEYARDRDKKVKVFHVGEMMLKHAQEMSLNLKGANILNADRDLLDVLRSAVFKGVLAEMSANTAGYDAFVVCIHAYFYWHKHYISALDKFLYQFSPDLYITFMDDQRNIIQRLQERQQWQDERLTEGKILEWQGLEIESTSAFADMANKPFFAVPTKPAPSLLYRLIFHPEIEPVYSAMPISHLTDPKDREMIDKFIEKLDNYFVVFNPLSIEAVGAVKVGKKDINKEEQSVISYHIIHRDLDCFIRRAEKVIVFWPERSVPTEVKADKMLTEIWPRVIPSPGIDHEMHEAFSKTKDVWLICMNKKVSPFVAGFCTKFFSSTKDFFNFLEEQYPERKDMKW